MYAAGLSEQNKQFYRVLGNNKLKFPDIYWVRISVNHNLNFFFFFRNFSLQAQFLYKSTIYIFFYYSFYSSNY